MLQLVFLDPDGPGPHTFEITELPQHGTLAGAGNDRTYTPDPGFAGVDSFRWTVNDGIDTSEPGTFTIAVIAATTTTPPPPPEFALRMRIESGSYAMRRTARKLAR